MTVGNLPKQLSSFIGRDGDIAEVKSLLAAQPLVTLTGPGGCGKTRLALQVAERAAGEFSDGVWLVELAPLADATLVPQAVASALGLRDQGGRPLTETVVDHLSDRTLLLVLDNCEHLVQACAQLVESLLRACPSLKILGTSREPLRAEGEVVWSVPPLSLPNPQPWRNPASTQDALHAYEESEAIQLLVARARSVMSGFSLTQANGAWVAEICRRLDGMPLAIELAAARMRSLSAQQIAGHLDDRFRLLTGGSRTAAPRQRTLEATLDWSYALLSETERKVLQRLSVFAGGCSLEAAEAVCSGEDLTAIEVMDAVARLVDKSLVVAETIQGDAHYRLLETIREYASKRLAETEGAEETRNRHLQYFVGWAGKMHPLLWGAHQLEGVLRLEADNDNLRAALDWSQLAEARAQLGLQLAAVAGLFWQLHGQVTEGRLRLAAALANKGAQTRTGARATVLHRLAVLVFYHSDYETMKALENESLAISRAMGTAGRFGAAQSLEMLGEAEAETGNYAAAFSTYDEALVLFREVGDLPGIEETVRMIGWSLMRTGQYEQAEPRFDEALVLCRQSGDIRHLSLTLAGLGELAIRRGQHERATKLLAESLDRSRSLGDSWGVAAQLGSLGWLALARGDFEQARALLAESITIRLETGDRGGMAWCLEKLAEAAALQAQPQRAVTLLGAATSLRAPVKSAIDAVDQPDHDRLLSEIRADLGQEVFAACWAEGAAMPAETMVDYALREPPAPAASSGRLDKQRYGGLTAREREVAALVAQGKSNREIAQAMTVGVKTVETYVTRILGKLGFDSRVRIATWMMEKGLDEKEPK